MRLRGEVKADLSKIKAIRERALPRGETMMKWKKRAARKYRSFLQKRFDRFSRGGGNWKSTQRKKAGKTKFILRLTHTLFRALSPRFRSLPGQYERIEGDSIVTGFGGSGKHPSGPITVAELARIHNNGEGIMARRQIVVQPNSELIQDLKSDLERTLKRG